MGISAKYRIAVPEHIVASDAPDLAGHCSPTRPNGECGEIEMKFSLFGITIEIHKSQEKLLRERRRKARMVLAQCDYSANAIERIKAVRILGLKVFPELEGGSIPGMPGLKKSKEWVEEAFLDRGKGDIA